MAGTSDELIYSDDYTRLARHDNRSFNLGDLSLAAIGGIAWDASAVAFGRTVGFWFPRLILPVGLGLWVLGASPLLALLLVPVLLLIEYSRASRDRDSGLKRSEEIALSRLGKKQPTSVIGWNEDRGPNEIDWQVIMFVPDWQP